MVAVLAVVAVLLAPRTPLWLPRVAAEPESVDVLHYDLDLTILPSVQEIQGLARVTVSCLAPTPSLALDLVGLTVFWVREGQDTVAFSHDGLRLVLALPQPMEPGQARTFTISYGGHPGHEPGPTPWGGFFFTGSMAYSVGVGLWADPPSMARYWFPCHDVPSDKATSTVTLRVPEGWVGISNGDLELDCTEDSLRVTRWHTSLPIATYLMAVAAGPYVELADSAGLVPIRHYVLPSQVDRARASFVHVPQMVGLFETLFGPYPFERFGYVASQLNGAMEHQTMVTLGSFAITGNLAWESLLAHELAHQWWGDCVTYADWTQIWVSEGFATYSEALWAEHTGGPAAYVAKVVDMMNEYLNSNEHTFPLDDPEVLWGAATYEKGACVLHMLRQLVGDSLFFAGLLELRARHGYGNATTDSVELAFEAATGVDLTWFFDQWVRSPGHPCLAFTYATFPYVDGGVGVELEVRQTQTIGPTFRMPLEVGVTSGANQHRFTFFDSLPVQVCSFKVPGPVDQLAVDPDRDLLYAFQGISRQERLLLAGLVVRDQGDADGGVDPGEEASVLVTLCNPFSPMEGAEVTLVCADPDIWVLDGVWAAGTLPQGTTLSNEEDPFVIRASAAAIPHAVDCRLEVRWASQAVCSVPFQLQLGTAHRLVVDDSGYPPYLALYLAALDTLPRGDDREVWSTALQGTPPPTRLAKYAPRGMVVWYTADAPGLDGGDLVSLASLLDAGGKLFLTGQDALDPLPSTPQGSAFLQDYLRVTVVDTACVVTKAIVGYPDDPIGNGILGVLQGPGGANNQRSLTALAPLEGAVAVCHYRNSALDCAARVETPGRVVVCSFGFEALSETQPQFTSRAEFIRRVADWLEGPGTPVPDGPPKGLVLSVPNPWRPGGCLNLNTSERVLVRLYDMAGRKVMELSHDAGGSARVALPPLPPGAYLLVGRGAGEEVRTPVVVLGR